MNSFQRAKLTLRALLIPVLAFQLSATTVTFPNFNSTAGLTLSGSAAAVTTTDGRVLRLVPAINSQTGSAFNSATINVASFSTFFQFRFTGGGTCPADGFVFVVQPVSSSIGGAGGGLGYAGITPSVGVEFDIFQNSTDPNANHIGVLSNGNVATYLGSGPFTPSTSLTDGNLWSAWIDYDGVNLTVRVADGSTVRPGAAALTVPVNVAATLGTSTAFVGFTAGTGACNANHDIISWTYTDSFAPIGVTAPVPSASTLSLLILGLGLGGAAMWQSRERFARMLQGR